MKINLKQLSKFLVKAKINTYASSGEGGEKILSDGGKEFKFKEGKFEYRDRYFGFNPFIGEEIVWQNEKIVWGMNYYGEVVSEIVPAKVFLKHSNGNFVRLVPPVSLPAPQVRAERNRVSNFY